MPFSINFSNMGRLVPESGASSTVLTIAQLHKMMPISQNKTKNIFSFNFFFWYRGLSSRSCTHQKCMNSSAPHSQPSIKINTVPYAYARAHTETSLKFVFLLVKRLHLCCSPGTWTSHGCLVGDRISLYSACYVAQLTFNYQTSGLKSPKYWDQWRAYQTDTFTFFKSFMGKKYPFHYYFIIFRLEKQNINYLVSINGGYMYLHIYL